MQEQFSSTTDFDSDSALEAAQPAILSRSSVRRTFSSARQPSRSIQATRIGAVMLGCAALGLVTCRHAHAQQEIAGSHSVNFATTSAFPLSLNFHQLSAGQTRAVSEFNWITLSGIVGQPEVNQSSAGSPATGAPSTHTVVVTIATERRNSALPYRRIYRMSRSAGLGQTNVARQGQAGLLQRTFQVTYRDNVPVSYHYAGRRVVKAPVDMIIDAGYTDRAARAMPSRSGLYTRAREIDMVATGYSPMEGSATGRCANGMRAGYGVVAVDPRLIPLGSKLFVEGYGYAFAGDTGGAIKGRRIDLGQNTYRAASLVGRRKVHVYVLSDAYAR